MTNELKNVPELRFSEFDGVWENSKLGTVANVYDGTHQTPKYTIEGIKFLSVENIKTLNSNKFISKEAFEKEFKIRPELGDVLMTRIGDVGTPNVIETNEDLAYYVSLALLKPKKLNSYFLESLIRSQTVQNELWRKTLHIAFPKKINKNEIAKVEINYPEQMEQQKIGEFFSKLDRQIELEEQKLEKLEEQKKGYMQQIFSQKLRFKDEIGNNYPNWEIEKLGDLINEVNERTISNNQYELLSSTKNGLLSQEEYFKKQIGSKDSTGYKILRLNQLVLSPQNLWLGNINFNQRFDIGIVSPSYRIYNLSHHFDINFAKYLLKSPRYIYEYAQASEQGASVVRRNLNLDLFYSIIISLPSIKEQRKIGSFLNKLDKLIEKQSDKIELLKERKKGFLQKMFV